MNKLYLNSKILDCERKIKYYKEKISAIDKVKEQFGLDVVGYIDKNTFIVSEDTDIKLDKYSVKITESIFYGCTGYLTYYSLKDKIKYTKNGCCKINLFHIPYGHGPFDKKNRTIHIKDYSKITDKKVISKIEKCIINTIISKKVANISGYNFSKFSQLLIFT